MPPILGPLIGLGQWVADKALDRFSRSHDMSVEMVPALAGYPDGSRVGSIIVTVRSRRPEPQKVEDVRLRLSNDQYLIRPIVRSIDPNSAIVTPTQPFETGFDFDDVKAAMAQEVQRVDHPVSIVGVRVRLTSGRTLRLKKKLDVNNQALFELRKGSAGSGA